jgi:hypothetical protein
MGRLFLLEVGGFALGGYDFPSGADGFVLSADRLALSADRFTLGANRFALDANRFTLGADRFALGADRFALGADCLALDADDLALDADDLALDAEEVTRQYYPRRDTERQKSCPIVDVLDAGDSVFTISILFSRSRRSLCPFYQNLVLALRKLVLPLRFPLFQ